MAENSSNRLLYFIFAWKCLSMCSEQLDYEKQIRLLDSLRKRSKSDIFCLSNGTKELSDLPIFVSLHVNEANNGLYRRVDSDAEGASSPYGPFIYAPNQDIAKKLSPSENLICDSPSEFKVILKNPFVFPIQLRNVRLLVDEESEAECESTSLLLPPQCTNYAASLFCKPAKCGPLKVLGVAFTFMSVQINFFVDNPDGLEFQVIPSQPLLLFTGTEFDKHVHLYAGERLRLNLPFEKHSFEEFRSLNISFTVQEYESTSVERIESLIFEESLQTAIQAESTIQDFSGSLPIVIEGHSQLHAFTANILYSGGVQFWRRLEVPFHCHLQAAIKVLECHFFSGKDKLTCILSLLFENCLDEAVVLSVNDKEYCTLSNRESLRVFLTIPRLCLDEINLDGKLPFTEKQVALIRKLKNSDNDGFLDHEYEEQLYDPIKYWIKKHLLEHVSITWKTVNSNRSGTASLSLIDIDVAQADIVNYRTPLISPNVYEFSTQLGEAVKVTFSAKPFEGEVLFKLMPLVDLGEGLLAVNYEDLLLISGPLESIFRAHNRRSFTFIPISTANFVIRYELTWLKTGKTISPADFIRIRTIN